MLVHHARLLILQLLLPGAACLSSIHAGGVSSRIRCSCAKAFLQTILVPLAATSVAIPVHAEVVVKQPTVYAWQWENGAVVIPDPLLFADKVLHQPRLLGSGGGGAVFAVTQDSSQRSYVVKTSWASSTESIENECRVLQLLEEKHVTNVERCLGIQPYVRDVRTDARRVMILLEPVMKGPIAASLADLSPHLQSRSVEMILKTMLEILSANVAVTDVQTLVSQETGDILFIDFSEARILSPSTEPLSFMEQALLSNFVQEVSAMIPKGQEALVSRVVSQFVKEQESSGKHLSAHTLILLEEQFLLDEI
ncbi:hypothetical protein FisN_13Lh174 [Fistulifera solaris]|uniref:Protein kinase domain-containing protein n=1 Tax=Fistulifera solaris TaxID=1519565 RepID=A0A1Z5KMB4_FISSO|nr:hypothetical protein FisN_13Lh174 [Fistulifera solaris]|eukprot:GAX27265.1 hypothetical protein FisN_13Lh174 [Fistulifera solaris]